MEHGIHLSKTQSKYMHILQWDNEYFVFITLVTKPAPDWNGTAVLNGEFIEMKLSDFRGVCNYYLR